MAKLSEEAKHKIYEKLTKGFKIESDYDQEIFDELKDVFECKDPGELVNFFQGQAWDLEAFKMFVDELMDEKLITKALGKDLIFIGVIDEHEWDT